MNIRMVDTITQYEKIRDEVDQAVQAVIRSGQYINGPVVKGFTEDLATFMDVPHVIPCANGTDALQIALMALGLQPGDEVITPSFTYIATVEVIALLQLKPVFVEVDPRTFNLDPSTLEAAITPRTKAIMPVHLFGQPAPMEPIMKIARKHGLYVVEDTAQAIGATYRFSDGREMRVGTIGDIGTTSFYPSKNLGAFGDGGALFTRDAELAAKLLTICNHGSNERYLHEVVGVNSRLDAVQAAILRVKLQHLEAYNQARSAAADRYDELLADIPGLELPYRMPGATHVFHQYTLRLTAGRALRDAVKAQLDAQGIPNMIYYPITSHLQAGYQRYGYQAGDLPLSEQLTAEVLSLPMHSELDDAQQAYLTQHLIEALKGVSTNV